MNNLKQYYNSVQFREKLDFNRIGLSVFLLMITSCIGSISVAFICTMEPNSAQLVALSLVTFTTMGANAAIIVLAPMMWILRLTVLSIFISLVCFIYAVI